MMTQRSLLCNLLPLLVIAPAFVDSTATIWLRQSDFDRGTFVITAPGSYRLAEDIIFEPNAHVPLSSAAPEEWLAPDTTIAPYNAKAFNLGFFAAIAIAASDVDLDLNGKTIMQGAGHVLMQRFFALIELANSPFPGGAGPADFGSAADFVAARNVKIQNGRLGRSSHHGIHGNNNVGVTLRDLVITDFEVVGVSLNRVDGLKMVNCVCTATRRDVEASARLSHAIFTLQTMSRRFDTSRNLPGAGVRGKLRDARDALRASLYAFLQNPRDSGHFMATRTDGLPDGSLVAGVMVNTGLNIGDFGRDFPADTNDDVVFRDVHISDIVGRPIEFGTLVVTAAEAPTADYQSALHVADSSAQVLEMDAIMDRNKEYTGNALSDAQVALGAYMEACKANAGCLSSLSPSELDLVSRNQIKGAVIDWRFGRLTWSQLLAEGYSIVGNHDGMFHLNKGAIGMKLDGLKDGRTKRVVIEDVENRATDADRSALAMELDPSPYLGFATRGLSVAGTSGFRSIEQRVDGMLSTEGPSIDVDLIGQYESIRMREAHSFHV